MDELSRCKRYLLNFAYTIKRYNSWRNKIINKIKLIGINGKIIISRRKWRRK